MSALPSLLPLVPQQLLPFIPFSSGNDLMMLDDDDLFDDLFPTIAHLGYPVLGFAGIEQDAVARHFEADGVVVVRLETFDAELRALVPSDEPPYLSAATSRLHWLQGQLAELTAKNQTAPVVVTGLCNVGEINEIQTRSACHLCAVCAPESLHEDTDVNVNAAPEVCKMLPRIVATTPSLLKALLQGRMHALVTSWW